MQGCLKLLSHQGALARGTFLDQRDRRDVGHGLGDLQVGVAEGLVGAAEQVERPNNVSVYLKGHGAHDPESGGGRPWSEQWPPALGLRNAGLHCRTGFKGVEAGALRALNLEELKDPHPLL